MKRFSTVVFLAAIFSLALLPRGVWAIDEEVRLKIINLQSYDFLLDTEKLSGCATEEGFIIPPGDVPFGSSRVMRWSGGCDVRLAWSIRYFTGLKIRVNFNAEDGKLKAYSDSDEFHPSVLGPRCEEGVCEYRLLIYNAEPWWD